MFKLLIQVVAYYFALCLCDRYIPVRWSRYAPSYLPPTFRKEDLQSSLDETDARRFQPIKAATIDEMSFTSYDALVTLVLWHWRILENIPSLLYALDAIYFLPVILLSIAFTTP